MREKNVAENVENMLMKFAKKTATYVSEHRCLAVTAVFVVLLIAAAILPLSPIHISYEAKFDRDVNKKSVTFVFDTYDPKPSLGRQSAIGEGTVALIRVDPVNYSSSTLTVRVKTRDSDIRLMSLNAVIHSDGREWCTVASLPAETFHIQDENGTVAFRAESQEVNHFYWQIRQKSVLKAGLIAVLVVLYLFFICRLTIFSRVRRGYFAASSVVAVGIIMFLFYLWFGRTGLVASKFPYKTVISGLLVVVVY